MLGIIIEMSEFFGGPNRLKVEKQFPTKYLVPVRIRKFPSWKICLETQC